MKLLIREVRFHNEWDVDGNHGNIFEIKNVEW